MDPEEYHATIVWNLILTPEKWKDHQGLINYLEDIGIHEKEELKWCDQECIDQIAALCKKIPEKILRSHMKELLALTEASTKE
jgi:hypothetical protein